MDRFKLLSLFLLTILASSSSEIRYEEKNKLVNGFIDFFNSLPNQIYTCDEGYLQNAQQAETLNCFKIEATLKVSDRHNLDSTKYLKCTGTVVDLGDVGVSVLNHHCDETLPDDKKEIEEEVVTETSGDAEAPFVTPVQLDNEVQTNTAVTSGEQFIAVPREEAKAHCIGCSSHVDPHAKGVNELASIGVRQLDSLEPNVQHSLKSVVDVERQVQVVNGIRYILTLLVDYNSCLTPETETCLNTKPCKINILEKPWVQLPDGSKYRAILSNNCTEEWRFGDDGVVIPQTPNNHNKINPPPSSDSESDDIIKPIHNIDVQSQQHTEKKLIDVDIKDIEQQIIPHDRFEKHHIESTFVASSEPTVESEPSKEHVVKVESLIQFRDNSIPLTNTVKVQSLTEDKKKAIDDMLSFFNFAGLDTVPIEEGKTRTKRSLYKDLNVMNLVEKFQKLKIKVDNAKYVYELARIVVDYLNEMDLEIKNRILEDVINAEEEFENHQHFYYVQFHVAIPCDTANCEEKNTKSKICNAVLDATEQHVKILNVFCHDEPKIIPLGNVKKVPFNDPVLLKLITEAVNKIESESSSGTAMKLNKIIDANTQRVSGILITFSIVLDYVNCDKSTPFSLRSNCSILEELGSQICDVTIHERHWLKERKITYTCNERPVDISFSSERKIGVKKNVSDQAILDMVQEALQYLELKSNRNNKQIVVRVNSIKTQLVAGLLTDIEFLVGYTTCSNDVNIDTSKCKLLEEEPLRTCKAQIWDRTWIEDGRQVDVSCSEPNSEHNELPKSLQLQNIDGIPKGSSQEKNENHPEYEELAEESLQKFMHTSGSNQHYELIDIQSATVQYVSGTLTKLKFRISPTDCQIDSTGKVSSFKCKVLDSTDLSICNSTIWKKTWTDFKEINATCQIVDKYSRVKRSMPGGKMEQNPNSPEYKKLAEESLKQYLQNTGNNETYSVVSIDKVETQVVSGKMTYIDFKVLPVACCCCDGITCTSKIWEQLWRNFKEINVSCAINHSEARKKRNISNDRLMPGGKMEQNPNSPEYKKLAEESLKQYLQNTGNNETYSVVSIDKVETQVVSGKMTYIDFKVLPVAQMTGDGITCTSKIWEQLWRNFKEINVSCAINRSLTRKKRYISNDRLMPGGKMEQNPNSPEYKKLAEESLKQYLQNTGNNETYSVVSIDKVETQVVSGKMTYIDFKVLPVAQMTGDGITCTSKIWEQLWRNFKEINVSCAISHSQARKKRYISNDSTNGKSSHGQRNLGGLQDEDPTKDKYKKIAQDSLMKYLKREKYSEPHSVVEVKKVAIRIVAGIIYALEFIAAPDSCASNIFTCVDESMVLYCNARVWDRMGRRKIDIECHAKNKQRKPRSLGVDIAELQDELNWMDMESDTDKEENREKRQINDDDYIDEDIRNYYADRAIKHINDNSDSNNLHKLITIHAVQNSMHMDTPMVRIYIETAETFCLRHRDEGILPECEELDGMAHQLCLARLWPSPDDELVINQVAVVCDDDDKFETISGLSVSKLISASLKELEKSSNSKYKLVHQGEPQVIPSLDSNYPITVNFVTASTNCSKNVQMDSDNANCFIDITRPSKSCQAYIWLVPNSRNIKKITAKCNKNASRKKRSVSLNTSNSTADDLIIQNMVQESLEKLEMSSQHRYKQRLLQINSYSTKITSGKVTTIDFDVGYTSCLKYEWVEDVKTCEFIEHLPRRHCVAQVWERLWLNNGRNIEVTCEEDETPLEAHVEFESADTAMKLANEALKHIEAKYPHERKQKVVRIFSLEKQVIAGIHYRMKVEVGSTQCSALSAETDCKLDKNVGTNKFCRVNVWMRPWTDHPPNFRVTCDYQEGAAAEIYHHLQAEQLFSNFLTTYKPEYINDHTEIKHRFEIFKTNIRKIHEFNTHEKGTATYGVTRFTDLSYEEFQNKYLGLKPSLRDMNQVPMRQAEIPNVRELPDKFDWRDYDAVTEVKNQGSCGSCWAFSVTGNIEGQWKMQSGQLVSLSEQELVDCDKLDQGCNGGLPDNAYRAIEQLGGLELENDYPYEGEDDTCSFNKTMSRVRISGAVNITSNETDMAKWLVKNGPISIGINANAMQFYMGGVSHPWKMLCNPTNLDHGVLIVGYGVKGYPLFHKKLPYWTIKNSWGPDWGEQGYYRVFRGDGTCGVNMMASSAQI